MALRGRVAVGVAIVAIFVVVIVAWFQPADPPEEPFTPDPVTQPQPSPDRIVARADTRAPDELDAVHRSTSSQAVAARRPQVGEDQVESDVVPDSTNAATERAQRDPTHMHQIEAVASGTNGGWEDPTNARVLGPKEWMAVADPEERARIDDVFEKWQAARYDPRLSNQERADSVSAVKAAVDACFAALRERVPNASGRLIVAWTAGAVGEVGRVTNPRIKVNYGLEDEGFEACVLDGAQNLRFGNASGEAIEVEAPFFYDGSF